jgi:hypothetical protein
LVEATGRSFTSAWHSSYSFVILSETKLQRNAESVRGETRLSVSNSLFGVSPRMEIDPGLPLGISLQRVAQFASGRIRRGGHNSVIFDRNSIFEWLLKRFYFEKRLPFDFV